MEHIVGAAVIFKDFIVAKFINAWSPNLIKMSWE